MIEHRGIIEKISGNTLSVRILQKSACSECHAKNLCMAADHKEKIIDINDYTGDYSINQQVVIEGKESIGYRAVWWAFVLPLLILVAMLVLAATVWDMAEIPSALLSMAALAPYYLMLYFLRDKMQKTFRFTIKKEN